MIVNSYFLPNVGVNYQGIFVTQQDSGAVSATYAADNSAVDTTSLNYYINVANTQNQASPSPIAIQIDLLVDFTIPEVV